MLEVIEGIATKEERKAEALKRLERLEAMGLHPNVRREFEDGVLNYSDRVSFCGAPMGALYWLAGEKRFAEAVAEFEDEYACTAYHATHEHTEFGELLTVFYVGENKEEWELDWEDLDVQHACCYVVNLDAPFLSEFGGVGFRVSGGGLVRTC